MAHRAPQDIVDRFDNLGRRMRALETGAHPIKSHLNYYDSMARTLMTDDSAIFTPSAAGFTPERRPYVEKRLGIVYLVGRYNGDLSDVNPDGETPEVIATLPAAALPFHDTRINILYEHGSSHTMTYGFVRENGEVEVYNPGITDGLSGTLYLDGINFIAPAS